MDIIVAPDTGTANGNSRILFDLNISVVENNVEEHTTEENVVEQ
jgi:hypothetical protein